MRAPPHRRYSEPDFEIGCSILNFEIELDGKNLQRNGETIVDL